MARLNEPIVSTDNLETLRRKFLRQNRDIARTNSTQSLKIRNLENECARLLSENLQLRSEILRLKTELEGSHAHRVADHALQIKEKMEAQLLEWGTMLASLGHEPVPKNRSPRALKKARTQKSIIGRTRTSDWRRRDTMGSMQDLEAAALQEGRLPPLWENKTYPRETLNQDEILALFSEAEESTDSPELGPPPVSRFVDEDPVKLDLSTLTRLLKPALSESDNGGLEDKCEKRSSYPNSPAAFSAPDNIIEEESKEPKESKSTAETANGTTEKITKSEPEATVQTAKLNLKRKTREDDEKENIPLARPPPPVMSVAAKSQHEKDASEKGKPINRPIKELPTNKKDSREKLSQATQRKPLGAKSSNGTLGAPNKSTKTPTTIRKEKPEAEVKDEEPIKGHLKAQQEPKVIEILPPTSPEIATRVDIEPDGVTAEPNLAIPDSPETSAPKEEMNDTPPPLDITSRGETTRANRRARAAVSYAEPNLRDKMRRPNTKQLFDAVAGDGRNVRRMSQYQKDEPPPGPSSAARSGAQSEPSRNDASSRRMSKDACQDTDFMASPSVLKTTRNSTLEELSMSTTTSKGKESKTQDHRTDEAANKPIVKGTNRRLEEIAAREAEVAKMFEESDVYEFTDSSLSSPKRTSEESALEGKSKPAGGRQPRSRKSSSVARDDLQVDDIQNKRAPGKHIGSRKRASMVARGESLSADADSAMPAEGEATTREKAASNRRRTTML